MLNKDLLKEKRFMLLKEKVAGLTNNDSLKIVGGSAYPTQTGCPNGGGGGSASTPAPTGAVVCGGYSINPYYTAYGC